jgi:hypothetical protein
LTTLGPITFEEPLLELGTGARLEGADAPGAEAKKMSKSFLFGVLRQKTVHQGRAHHVVFFGRREATIPNHLPKFIGLHSVQLVETDLPPQNEILTRR